MGRRWDVVGALTVGCATGWMLSHAFGCGSAKADTGSVMDVPCNVQGTAFVSGMGMQPATFAVQHFDGRGKEDLAANVLTVRDNPPVDSAATIPGIQIYEPINVVGGPPSVGDGVVAVLCQPGQTSARLFVR